MAVNKSHIVRRGDTLSEIAWEYSKANNYVLGTNSVTATNKLAQINGLSKTEANHLSVGQKLYMTTDLGSSAVNELKPTNAGQVSIKTFGTISSDENRRLIAIWNWSRHSETDNYHVIWQYQTDKTATWLSGRDASIQWNNGTLLKEDIYTADSAATRVRFRVLPNAKEKSNGVRYWDATWIDWEDITIKADDDPGAGEEQALPKPPVPNVEIKGNALTASVDNVDGSIVKIEFEVRQDSKSLYNTGTAKKTVSVTYTAASFSCTVADGHEYAVRCRGVVKSGDKSDWTDYSGNVGTKPTKPSGIAVCKATSENSVYLKWGAVSNAETYEIEYAKELGHFDVTNQTTTVQTTTASNEWNILDLDSGCEYFFRVRAVNGGGNLKSDWTGTESVILGVTPSSPTTWSSTTTAIVGESVTLYWIHNCADGSAQTKAIVELELTKNTANGKQIIHTESVVIDTTNEPDDEKTMKYVLNTSSALYAEGVTINWRVRTSGITKTDGPFSVPREINIYTAPTAAISLTDVKGNNVSVIESFPIYFGCVAGPNTQKAIGYHVTVVSDETYETVDNIGNDMMVNAGDEIYSKYFDTSEELLVVLSASNINLENGRPYTISCIASMDSGLTAASSIPFTVSWTDRQCKPNAEIEFDSQILATYIHPYCDDSEYVYTNREFTLTEFKEYIKTLTDDGVYGYNVSIVTNTTYNVYIPGDGNVTMTVGDMVYYDSFDNAQQIRDEFAGTIPGMSRTADYTVTLVTTTVNSTLVEGVTLSVYRREFDGSFTELATGINNGDNTFITDPHPALDFARYRIIATFTDTGSISYYDIPGVSIKEKSVIIQWDETWTTFNTHNDDKPEQPPWAGSMLKLLYNIDVTDSYDPDYSLIEYIGREHPVSYYGTQKGTSAIWSMEIDKSDKDTLYALRRLAIWMGDAYVREPSGSGYWANVNVSFSQKHKELTIPVTLKITRVEGGA